MLYPWTQRRLDWVATRKHDGLGQITSSIPDTEKGWIAYNIPAFHNTILGLDPAYITAFNQKFHACEVQYHQAQAVERQYNAATGPEKEGFARQLDDAKTKLRVMVEELINLQPNPGASLADADAQVGALTKPTGGLVASAQVNSIGLQMGMVRTWYGYAGSAVTGK